jgi:cell division protein FtsL
MYIKVNGKMIKHMEKVFIIIMMDQVILVNGSKIYNKVMEFKNGLMDHIIKGILF